VDAWFYEGLAGIRSDPAAPGFARFRIAPQVVGGLTSVQASYRSPYGVIRSEWTVAGDRLTLLVEVPPNTTATIQIPTTDPTQVTESGKAIGKALCEVGSGRYTFVAPY
jgi:alpha-L-rhamnosidase